MSQTPNSPNPDTTGGATSGEGSILGGSPPAGGVNDTLLGQGGDGGGAVNTPETEVITTPAGADPQGVLMAPLPDTATDDQKRDFQNKLRALQGVPSAPGDYGNFGFGEDVKIDANGEDYKYYTNLFHKVGLNQAQAKQLLEAHKVYADKEVERIQKHNDQIIKEYRTKVTEDFVKSLGGAGAYEVFQVDARRGFKAVAKGANLSETEVAGLLNIMGDDPRFVKVFNHIGKNFKEDVLVTGATPSAPEPTMEKIFEGMFKQ